MFTRKSVLALALAAVVPALTACAGSASTAQVDDSALYARAAKGDITKFAGARRLSGNMTDVYQQELQHAAMKSAKNVILLIGDGMGDSEITAARNFAHGAGGMFKGLDALPFTGQYTHYSLNKDTLKPDYVTDSAASGTAWSTGVKSYNGAIGVDVFGNPHDSLIDLAKRAGKATGDVSTAEIQDATPAAQIASVVQRKCYGPNATSEKCPTNALENGGAGSISEQLLALRPDVTLGGGSKSFNEVAKAGQFEGKTLFEQAEALGYTLVDNLSELNAVDVANQDKPLLGLFSEGNMPIRLKGPQAKLGGNLTGEVVKCEINSERGAEVPTLAQMTAKAIDLLDDNPNGFFLQVEGASIDKQAHASNPCGQFGETMDLDEAVQVALDFARKDGNTLVIVTADHAHSTQICYPDAKSMGFTQAVMTADGAPMTVSYANSEDVNDTGHTGAQLRIAAYGPGALNVVGLTDQTDLFFTIRDALGLQSK
ncbi:MAG: alkaline phosphatase [Candidatus Anaerobiospirillum merdipullorum]|uniref:Alkaline phosphatase n=1 Tax=Candidatus Anaerobiospirillum merdipullorum TaxID=2838450 RepID=A0A9E2KQC0_9GAMM|nr:alkaline phosphatase [Candidatus Anaerobiospirillum merdipullorum]